MSGRGLAKRTCVFLLDWSEKRSFHERKAMLKTHMCAVETIVSITLLAAVCSVSVRAQIMAVESTYNPGETYYSIPINSTYGWQFRVRDTPISVTHLGYFDRGLDGLADSHA